MTASLSLPKIHWAIILVCVLLLLPGPFFAIYDRMHPWPVALAKLDQRYAHQTRVCIGWFRSGFWQRTPTQTSSLVLVSRTYLLFPRVLTYPTMVTVTASDLGESHVDESWLFWLMPEIGFYGLILLVLGAKALQVCRIFPSSEQFNQATHGVGDQGNS